jgi:acyl-lipid omega-6 desaturase (Delta-12 desaturase)
MKEGKELILATKPYATDQTLRSWWCVLSTTFLLLATLTGTLAPWPLFGKAICSLLAGLLILRLFVIYHDQQHHAILPNSRLADIYMRLFGIFALSPSSIWRSSHNHHHNHNSKLRGSHIGSFPIMTREQFLKSSKKDRRQYLFMRHPLVIFGGYFFVFLGGMCALPLIDKPREHYDCLISLCIHVAIGVLLAVFVGWAALFLTWIIPFFIASGIGSYLFYAQHNFPGVTFNDASGWTYEKAALESSSFLKTDFLMSWFTANIGYHHIHHLNSRIPFYRLPEVFKEIVELQRPKITSLDPMEVFRCLQLKVWDVEAQRMIGLAEMRKGSATAVPVP